MNGGIRENKMLKDIKGFSLIELIIVISILSILLIIPMFKGNSILSYKERIELKEFKNDINYARNKAIIESKLYRVKINCEENSYTIYKSGSSVESVKKKELTEGIKINYTNIRNDEIEFSHSGAPLEAGTIFLENKQEQGIEITITPATGKVNIYFNR